MVQVNDNFLKLKAGYLFPEIGRRVKAFCDANPDAASRVIRLGIGDVTEPLPPAIVVPSSAIHDGKVYVSSKDNRLALQPVETGLTIVNMSVIYSGLKPGDRVVVSDLAYALPKMLLRVTRDATLEKEIAAIAAGAQDSQSGGQGQ